MGEPPGALDIEQLASAKGYQLTLKPQESSDELKHRLNQSAYDAKLRRAKEYVTIILAIIVIMGIGAVCVYFIVKEPPTLVSQVTAPQGTIENSVANPKFQWATQILQILVSGLIGWMAGKASQGEKTTESK